jgi:hypothetical protein
MKAIAKLTWRLSRFEIVGLALASAIVTAAALVVTRQLQSLVLSGPCQALIQSGTDSADLARCPGIWHFGEVAATGSLILVAASLLPLVAGALLGSQLVARDVDYRSAQLAWWLSTSRLRWLVERVVPLGLLMIVLFTPPAIASAMLEGAMNPNLDIWHSFIDFGQWGPLFVTSAIAALAVGVLAGSVLGRILPSLLVSVAAAALLYMALPNLPVLAQSPDVFASGQPIAAGSVLVSGGCRQTDGTVLSLDAVRANAPADLQPDEQMGWVGEHCQSVELAIPGDRAPVVTLTAALLAGVIAVVAFGAAALAVVRRRPY